MRNAFSALILLSLLIASAYADGYSVTIKGTRESVVSKVRVELGDIAQIQLLQPKADELAVALSHFLVADGLSAGKSITLQGEDVLKKLKAQGFTLEQVGYELPRQMVVKRAARPLSTSEVEQAIRATLKQQNREADLRTVLYDGSALVPVDATNVSAVFSKRNGQLDEFYITATNGNESSSLPVRAQISEWRVMPVAARALARGTLIDESSVSMARMNAKDLPRDIVGTLASLLGQKITADLNAGELFRTHSLERAQLITKGELVTAHLSLGNLEATTKAIALDSGAQGDFIRVQNESSKKIFSAVVKEQGLVEVTP